MNIVAVIPAYNEEKNIYNIIKQTKRYVDDIIIIDDCSNDNTYEIVKSSSAQVIKLITNMGAGFATRVGCDIAIKHGADIIVTIDADGQHNPNEISKLIDYLILKKLDIVFGSRKRNENMPVIKRIGNFGLSIIINIFFQTNISDSQTGFHVFTKEAYKKIRWKSCRYGFVSEISIRTVIQKLRYDEVPVQTLYNNKIRGMSVTDGFKSLFSIIKWRFKI